MPGPRGRRVVAFVMCDRPGLGSRACLGKTRPTGARGVSYFCRSITSTLKLLGSTLRLGRWPSGTAGSTLTSAVTR